VVAELAVVAVVVDELADQAIAAARASHLEGHPAMHHGNQGATP